MKLFLVLFLFFFIYTPQLLPVDFLHVIAIIAFSLIIFYRNMIVKTMNLKYLQWIYLYLWFLIIYLIFVIIVNSSGLRNLSTYLYYFLEIIPAAIIVVFLFLKNKYNLEKIIHIFLIVGFLQSIVAIIFFIFSDIRYAYIDYMISMGASEVFQQLAYHRMYGISSNLTYATPIFQGVLASVALYFALMKNWKYVIYVPFIAFSAVINSRTAMVVLVMGVLIIILHFIKTLSLKSMSKLLVIIVFIFAALIVALEWFKKSTSYTFKWIADGYDEIKRFLLGERTGYFNYITNEEKWILPDSWNFIFGEGTYIVWGTSSRVASDIGWVNDFWYGGLLYVVIIYSSLFICYLILRFKKGVSQDIKFIFDLIFITFIIMNFKGVAVTVNEVLIFALILFLSIILNKNKL